MRRHQPRSFSMAVPLLVLAWLLVGCGEITRSNPFDPHGTAYSGGSEMANSNGGGSASSSAVGGSASSSSLPIVYDTLMFDDLSGRAAAPANANLMKGGAWHLPIDLTTNNIVIKNTIAGIDYYEIQQDHHHHLVCVSCNSISKVEIGNHLEKQEKQIAKQNKFNIIHHSLEFYGYCQKCQA